MVQGVTGPTRREACGSICRLLLEDMVKTQAGLSKIANRYTEGKAEEYSGKLALSAIGKQCPEGKVER